MSATKGMFGRINADGNVVVLMVEDGAAVTRIDADVYPVGSSIGTRYEHPEGVILTPTDAAKIKLEIES